MLLDEKNVVQLKEKGRKPERKSARGFTFIIRPMGMNRVRRKKKMGTLLAIFGEFIAFFK